LPTGSARLRSFYGLKHCHVLGMMATTFAAWCLFFWLRDDACPLAMLTDKDATWACRGGTADA
jgi:hypothetical protein